METIIITNILAALVIYLLVAYPSKSFNRRLNAAKVRLNDTTVDKAISSYFTAIVGKAGRDAMRTYWLVVFVLVVGGPIIAYLFAIMVESDAQIEYLLYSMIVPLIFYGIAFIGLMVSAGYAVSTAWKAYVAQGYLAQLTVTYPLSPVISEVAQDLNVSRGAIGGLVITWIGIVSSVVFGVIYIAFLFLAAQTAIECARSSKCL